MSLVLAPVAPTPWALSLAQARAWLLATGDVAGERRLGRAAQNNAAPLAPPLTVVLASVRHVATPLLVAARAQLLGGQPHVLLHGDESMVWHRVLRLHTPYRVSGRVEHCNRSKAGLALRIQAQLTDAYDGLVAETRSSLLFVASGARVAGQPDGQPTGPMAQAVQQQPAWTATWQVGARQPERYARASGDDNPLHQSDALAQVLGLVRRPLHGLCSLAFAARSLAQAASGPDPGPGPHLASLRGRFRRPVYPGDTLTCKGMQMAGEKMLFAVINQHGEEVIGRGAAAFAALSAA